MQYRKLGKKIDADISVLGFGCMRFPIHNDDPKQIDIEKSEEMLRYAIDNGVNYLDTAYVYHGGESESFIGNFLRKNGLRDKVFIADKLPVWLVNEADDLDRLYDEQLQRLQVDKVDFFLFHALSTDRLPIIKQTNAIDWAVKQQAAGRIGAIGFSFHDKLPLFKEIIDMWDGWQFCQVQYNYMNEDYQAGTEGVNYAAARGIGVIDMEPLLGGFLANPTERVKQIFAAGGDKYSPVDYALHWLWNKPEVPLVLSGMSTLQQVKQNVAAASKSRVGLLTDGDLTTIRKAGEAYMQARAVGCTACDYCMPCPGGVNIPGCFNFLNSTAMFGQRDENKRRYNIFIKEEARADQCSECGECLSKCPQQIAIIDKLKEVTATLA